MYKKCTSRWLPHILFSRNNTSLLQAVSNNQTNNRFTKTALVVAYKQPQYTPIHRYVDSSLGLHITAWQVSRNHKVEGWLPEFQK